MHISVDISIDIHIHGNPAIFGGFKIGNFLLISLNRFGKGRLIKIKSKKK